MPVLRDRSSSVTATVHRQDRAPSPPSMEALLNRILDEMGHSWRAGRRPLAEEFLSGNPEVGGDTESAVRLIYEELCLREEVGEQLPTVEVVRRFPQWRNELEVLLGCHRLLQAEAPPAQFPEVGEKLGDFELLAELGRGAEGRVFLAREITLANRPVVLKLTPRDGREHLSLARLLHTNIVPLYAVQDYPERNLRSLCMPSLGGTTLTFLLTAVKDSPLEARRGTDVLDALDRHSAGMPVAFERHGPARAVLARGDFAAAIAWIGACLAEALHHAHERNLIHLDIKPSNVLLAADGQPMLLDFHLAQAPIPEGDPPTSIGGTLDYMAPEQRTALQAVQGGQRITVPVDARSDVYSLGLVLYDALGGAVPVNTDVPLPPLHRCNAQVSVGLSDILERMLAPEPGRRYASAGDVAADLRRHLDDQPLRGVANRSLGERWHKWRRRRPYALVLLSLAGAFLFASALVGATLWSTEQQRRRDADAAWNRGNQQMSRERYDLAAQEFGGASALTEGWLADGAMHRAFAARQQEALRAHTTTQLREFADHLRFTFAVGYIPPAHIDGLDGVCRKLWDKRDELLPRAGAAPGAAHDQAVREDFFDLAYFWGELQVRKARPKDASKAREHATAILTELVKYCGSTPALRYERRLSAGETVTLDELAPQTPWEYWSLGRSMLSHGDVSGAERVLGIAEKLQTRQELANRQEKRPTVFPWARFYRGLCARRRGQAEEAERAFWTCVDRAPSTPECYYFRAWALTRLGRPADAREDLDQAIGLQRGFAAAFLERGILNLQLHEVEAALSDLRRAAELGTEPSKTQYHLARAYLARGDTVSARACIARAREADPGSEEVRALERNLRP